MNTIGQTIFACLMLFTCTLSNVSGVTNDRPLIYGMNPIPGDWANHGNDKATWEPAEFSLMRDAGCTSVRVGVGWDLVEPHQGDRNWGDIDEEITRCLDRGFEPVFLIVATPPWALPVTQQPPFYAPPLQYKPEFEKFIFDCARKFRGRVRYYEFWNEENGCGWHHEGEIYQWANEYVPWLIYGYNSIKRGDPQALWSIGGLDDSTAYGDDYLTKCYNYMSKGYFDAVCEHPYSQAKVDLTKMDDLRRVMSAYGDGVPIWITELGWTANGRESQVAGWITDYFDRLSTDQYSYCKIATYHTAVDFTAEPYGFGLMTYDLVTKPTYDAFKNHAKPQRASVPTAPTVTSLGPGKVKIDFSSSIPATAQIMYGPTNCYGMITKRETVAASSHSFTIDGLSVATSYHYRIRVGAGEYADNFSADYTFTTTNGPSFGISGDVTVTNVTTNSATISWSTTEDSRSRVDYSLGYDYSNTVSDSNLTQSHNFTINGLQPNSVYQVRVVATKSGYASLIKEIDPIVTKRVPGVLSNGGFESPGPRQPWIIYGNNSGRVTGVWDYGTGFSARTGSAFFGSKSLDSCKNGGCYQKVGAVPGRLYRVTAWNKAMITNNLTYEGARLGIDPTGGTNPKASTVIWGAYGASYTSFAQIDCIAEAVSDEITVFVDISQQWSRDANINIVDDVELYQPPAYVSMREAKTVPVGQQVAVNEAICTANLGSYFYIQAFDRTNALRVNFTSTAKVGDTVIVTGTSSFTGLEKSIDAVIVKIQHSGTAPKPVNMLIKNIGGSPLPGQSSLLFNNIGVNNLNQLVQVNGWVVKSAPGYLYIYDGSGSVDSSGYKGIKVVYTTQYTWIPEGWFVSLSGIVGANMINDQWVPVIRRAPGSSYKIFKTSK